MRSELLLVAALVVACPVSSWASGETITLPGGVPLTLERVPAGTFAMGSLEGERGRFDDEGPQRDVTLSQSFYLGTGGAGRNDDPIQPRRCIDLRRRV